MLVYDPQSDAWTRERPPFWAQDVAHACAHKGRVVVFLKHSPRTADSSAAGLTAGTTPAFERAADGAWSLFVDDPFLYGVDQYGLPECHYTAMSGSVLLG